MPVMRYNIPITIRNVFNVGAPGTVIGRSSLPDLAEEAEPVPYNSTDSLVKGFATIDNIALVNVEGYITTISPSGTFLAITSPFSVMIEDFPLTRIWPYLHRKEHQHLVFVLPIFLKWAVLGCRTGMVGVPGTASEIFEAVKGVGANVVMISQVWGQIFYM